MSAEADLFILPTDNDIDLPVINSGSGSSSSWNNVARQKKDDDLQTVTTPYVSPQPPPSPFSSPHPQWSRHRPRALPSNPVCTDNFKVVARPRAAQVCAQPDPCPWWRRTHLFHQTVIALLFVAVAVILVLQQDSISHIKKELAHQNKTSSSPSYSPLYEEERRSLEIRSISQQQQRSVSPLRLQMYGFTVDSSNTGSEARYPLQQGVDVDALASVQLCCSNYVGVLDCSKGSVRAIKDFETGEQYFSVRPNSSSSSCTLTYTVITNE